MSTAIRIGAFREHLTFFVARRIGRHGAASDGVGEQHEEQFHDVRALLRSPLGASSTRGRFRTRQLIASFTNLCPQGRFLLQFASSCKTIPVL
jgi:hypothetical protein